MGYRGLKLIGVSRRYDEPDYLPTYAAAERLGMPVLFHLGVIGGGIDYSITQPAPRSGGGGNVPPHAGDAGPAGPCVTSPPTACRRCTWTPSRSASPTCASSGAHLGNQGNYEFATSIARWRPNVALDMSGGETIERHAVELNLIGGEIGIEKLVFGSDCGMDDIREHIDRFEAIYDKAPALGVGSRAPLVAERGGDLRVRGAHARRGVDAGSGSPGRSADTRAERDGPRRGAGSASQWRGSRPTSISGPSSTGSWPSRRSIAAVGVESAVRSHPDWRGGAFGSLSYALLPLLGVVGAGLFIDEAVSGYARLAAGLAGGRGDRPAALRRVPLGLAGAAAVRADAARAGGGHLPGGAGAVHGVLHAGSEPARLDRGGGRAELRAVARLAAGEPRAGRILAAARRWRSASPWQSCASLSTTSPSTTC